MGSINLTVPDSKDSKILAAKDLFNTRTGNTYTIQQWIKYLVKRAVVDELSYAAEKAGEIEVENAKTALENAQLVAQQSLNTTRTTEDQDWEV